MRCVELTRGRDYLGRGVKAYKGIPLKVSDEKADELVMSGFFRYSDAGKDGFGLMASQEEQQKEQKEVQQEISSTSRKKPDLGKMKTAELEAYAAEHEIDLSGCRTNADRVSMILSVMQSDEAEPNFGSNGMES